MNVVKLTSCRGIVRDASADDLGKACTFGRGRFIISASSVNVFVVGEVGYLTC